MESELFGHVRGAFTGADRDRAGKCAEVGRGTLLLDEINALSLELQAKLLRVVEERLFEAVGSNRSQPLQARLIVASNRRLEQEEAAGRFRSDLHYRLNVVGFFLPPLRERRDLIRPLAERLLAEFAARNDRPVSGLTAEALDALEGYAWPGNIRELRNVIERGVALCPGSEVQLADLTEAVQRSVRPTGPGLAAGHPEGWLPAGITAHAAAEYPEGPNATLVWTKEKAEATHIAAALKRNDNNRLRAAAELGISRMTLYKKLHRYGLMGAEA
jgi:DNA-binding NtrC family response regulator